MRPAPPPLLAAARCGLAVGDRPLQAHRGQPPLATWPRAIAPCGLAVSRRHLRVSPCILPLCGHRAAGGYRRYGVAAARRAYRCRPSGWPPLHAGLGRGLAMGGRPCMWVGHPSFSLPSL
ncbi:hypothetical protein GW17_00015569 [Ensete ventricosum]|nr:hypothetical protein GW17_00015569 [Ensete ventricosum]RZR96345.1 hypothetical protein BHM03_00025344 [Ensete ventricosum]